MHWIDIMLAGKNLIDYTNFFSPYDFKKKDDIILSYLKMTEVPMTYLNSRIQTQQKLNEINKIKNYFTTEIQEREVMSKILSK